MSDNNVLELIAKNEKHPLHDTLTEFANKLDKEWKDAQSAIIIALVPDPGEGGSASPETIYSPDINSMYAYAILHTLAHWNWEVTNGLDE
jgi:hypothetical protein